MSDALLVLSAGSSSLKFSVFLNQNPPQPGSPRYERAGH
jgi:acetate kinase